MATSEPQTKKSRSDDEIDSKENKNQSNSTCSFSEEPSLETIRQMLEKFAVDRNWNQYHTPRNLLLALTAEVGELSEIFQWKGEVQAGLPDFTEAEKQHVGQELSDVLAYLVRLADRCDIDLTAAIVDKIALNAKKYPVNKVYGKSNKYTDYQDNS